ncbi:uncharacterized protein LOC127279597 [Leptopilina boulardi]|uniref:uncharacterized protein LOC127279597 n=1 Tax=Leptopilina boulardi TaxID=63433 RepID=UPI0021F5ABF8|nr:uncharacterized protein LOC127279597 [Leptopilina boulardi]
MCPNLETKNVTDDSTSVKNDCILANQSNDPEVFMQTLKVKLCNENKGISVRVVIDTGSQKSYITKEMCKLIGYEPISEQLMIHSLFGGKNSGTVTHKKYNVRLESLNDRNSFNFVALDQNVICNHVPSVKNGIWIQELKKLNIKISDFETNDNSVALLIGADFAGRLLTGQRKLLDCGLVAVETVLGWTLMGEVPQNDIERENPILLATTLFVKNDNISDLWSLEVLGIKDPIELKTQGQLEEEVTQELLKTLKMNEEGRYEVELPWLPNHPELKDNKDMAMRRLQSTVKKLKSEELYEAYDAVLDDWMQEGIIEYVPKEEEDQWGRYLPHRHVLKENSTTKLRPVFDGSARDKSSPSLNECLERGPNLIEMVTSNLLRFRQGKIGIVSDIKKAFLQISIDPRDRDSLRFLWLSDNGETVILRHRRVVFGVNSSSFILNVVINEHLQKTLDGLLDGSITKYSKENIAKLKKSFYVDNCLASVNSSEELTNFIIDSRAVMEEAGFDLRGWEYNHDNSHQSQAVVLGLIWNKEDDCFSLNLSALDQC